MPTTPNIDHDVQRCRELIFNIRNPRATSGQNNRDEALADSALLIIDPLEAVLAELERLREVERDYLYSRDIEYGERNKP